MHYNVHDRQYLVYAIYNKYNQTKIVKKNKNSTKITLALDMSFFFHFKHFLVAYNNTFSVVLKYLINIFYRIKYNVDSTTIIK